MRRLGFSRMGGSRQSSPLGRRRRRIKRSNASRFWFVCTALAFMLLALAMEPIVDPRLRQTT
jgi:hypothetical protein